jgi:hypothetical protein
LTTEAGGQGTHYTRLFGGGSPVPGLAEDSAGIGRGVYDLRDFAVEEAASCGGAHVPEDADDGTPRRNAEEQSYRDQVEGPGTRYLHNAVAQQQVPGKDTPTAL